MSRFVSELLHVLRCRCITYCIYLPYVQTSECYASVFIYCQSAAFFFFCYHDKKPYKSSVLEKKTTTFGFRQIRGVVNSYVTMSAELCVGFSWSYVKYKPSGSKQKQKPDVKEHEQGPYFSVGRRRIFGNHLFEEQVTCFKTPCGIQCCEVRRRACSRRVSRYMSL